jgi:flagellar biosynthesis protein FlhF
VYLALAATTKASDTEEILRQFEPFGYRAVVLTKLDETMRIGNIISCLSRLRKPIAYLCDGQGVPQDIQEAGVIRLLMNMEGFRVDRESLEKRFARGAAAAPLGKGA